MARHSRRLSESNIYHIVLKGINSQQLFFSDYDYSNFISVFSKTCKEYNVDIYAFCLMNNHIHFLLKFNENEMSSIFKSFGAKYAPRYNERHNRIGPLFNGRYYSSPINDDEYLCNVLKYIHYNPVNAGLVKRCCDYKWSSYKSFKDSNSSFGFVDTKAVLELIGENNFDIIHTANEKDFIEFFALDNKIFSKSTEDIESFVENAMNSISVNDCIEILSKAGLTKSKISKLLKIDRRML